MPGMRQQVIAAGSQALDIDTLADEVAWWTRQVARDPRIGADLKATIAARFAEGLALARSGAHAKPAGYAVGGTIADRADYRVGENVSESTVRIDPGADERARRSVLMRLRGR